MFIINTPTTVRLEKQFTEEELDRLKKLLTYTSRSAIFQYNKFRHSKWFLRKHGQEAFNERLEQLNKLKTKCLLRYDAKGLYTYSGLVPLLQKEFPDIPVINNIQYPEPKGIPWERVPKHELRYYQEETKKRFLETKHCGCEIGTGLGKSFVILNLCKELGLKTVVMAPSTNIAKQLYDDLVYYLGKKYVGFYGGGRKQSTKLIVVGIDDSLTRVEPNTPHWENLSRAQVFIADESHLTPAETLHKVCMELLANAPYRFFFSGTQTRNDGSELVLQGIVGPIVYKMTVQEGVEQGFLAKPEFFIVKTTSDSAFISDDPNEMTRKHFFYNDRVNRAAADIANKTVLGLNEQVVILIDEIEQFNFITPYLRVPAAFAHGPITPPQKKILPKQYHDSDPSKLVEEFNNGIHKLLIGTSCISTGTDIRTVKTIILIQSGKSEIKFKQAVGRGTRRVEGKDSVKIFDFDVTNVEVLHRHSRERSFIYTDIYNSVRYV